MSPLRDLPRRAAACWCAVWPSGSLLLLAGLAATGHLMAGYPRAVAAVAILVAVPGSLTLGAALSPARRPGWPLAACWAVLLGLSWPVFATLGLSVLGVRITASSLQGFLLAGSAALAVVAQVRLLLHRAARRGARTGPRAGRSAGVYAAAAIAAGVSLLAGALCLHDLLPRPAPAGYTWLAWTGPQAGHVVSVGSTGSELHFQIARRERGTASFQLTAVWLGTTHRLLAGPLKIRLGPDRTYRGSVLVPPPGRCTGRIALILRADRQTDPLTGRPRVWAINADVRRAGPPAKPCA